MLRIVLSLFPQDNIRDDADAASLTSANLYAAR